MPGVWRKVPESDARSVGKEEIIYLTLHCPHQNDFCIKVGSDESHFNVLLICEGPSLKGSVHRTQLLKRESVHRTQLLKRERERVHGTQILKR